MTPLSKFFSILGGAIILLGVAVGNVGVSKPREAEPGVALSSRKGSKRPIRQWQVWVLGLALGFGIGGLGFILSGVDDGETGRWFLAITGFLFALILMFLAALPERPARPVWQGRSVAAVVGLALSIISLAIAMKDVVPPSMWG